MEFRARCHDTKESYLGRRYLKMAGCHLSSAKLTRAHCSAKGPRPCRPKEDFLRPGGPDWAVQKTPQDAQAVRPLYHKKPGDWSVKAKSPHTIRLDRAYVR